MKHEGNEQANHDFFGYLPYKGDIKFEGGRITPIQEFDQVSTVIEKYTEEEGFIYPADGHLIKSDLSSSLSDMFTFECQVPFFQYVFTSHVLCLKDSEEDIRSGSGAFLIHLLAYLFGVRLQFKGWWLDGRIPVKRTHSISFSKKTLEKFLSHCYQTWQTWPKDLQYLITNILYIHSRVPSYEWPWEQFMIEFMVFDGCWKLTETIHKLQRKKLPKLFIVLCEKYGIPFDKTLIADIVQLRTDLFHETLWNKGQLNALTNGSGFDAIFRLRNLNKRLIPAILGYDTPYIKTGWWFMGTFQF